MRRVLAWLIVGGAVAAADTATPTAVDIERFWRAGSVVAHTNDTFTECVLEGDVLVGRIHGRGESCVMRKARLPLRLPCRVQFRLRVSNPSWQSYPSVHVIFDPPPPDDPWWRKPISGSSGVGTWNGGRQSFLFHPSSDPAWRRVGLTPSLDNGPPGLDYAAPCDRWLDVMLRLERDRVTVTVDGVEVARCAADLSSFRTFTWAIGDQTATRVELDEVRIDRR